jgi:hypothetical protein
MFDDFLTDDIRKAVHTAIEGDSNVLLDRLAEEYGIPEGAVVAALDTEMCAILPAGDFERTWAAMTQWEKVNFIATTPGAIVEVNGRLPKGKHGYGFFNIGADGNPLSGHIKINDLEAICLVSKPFMGLESHSVRFYNQRGELMFAVYVGREGKRLIPSVKEGFMDLRRLAAGAVNR